MKSINIPTSVKTLKSCALCNCGLTTITIPVNVSKIVGNNPFEGCDNLTRIDVDEENTHFISVDGVLLDAKCEKIIQFPKARAGEYIIPETVKTLNSNSFKDCRFLTSITIPPNVATISAKLFSGCSSLTSINVDERNLAFKSIDGVLFNEEYYLYEYPEGRKGSYVIPDNTFYIRSQAFKGCSGLTSITIPPLVFTVRYRAFEGCSNLNFVSYLGSSNPLKISDEQTVFDGCDSLNHICVPIGYTSKIFCERNDFCKTSSCTNLHLDGDHCYEESCLNGNVVIQKRKNATEYEEQLHACVDYICDKNIGPVTKSMCLSSKEQRYMCINDGCLAFGTETRVEIDIEDGVFVGDVDLDKLDADVKQLTGIDNCKIGVELTDDGYIIQIVILIDDEDAALNVVEVVKNIDHNKCKDSVLCRAKTVRLMNTPLVIISKGSMNHVMIFLLLLTVLIGFL